MASIAPESLLNRIDSGKPPTILDVRSAAEFEAGHVPGAVNLPFTQARDASVPVPASPDQEIIVYCGHGPRAWIAGAALRRRGFTNVTYLKGHMRGWKKARFRQER
jgi:rhodanese-related sulfurtransferase